MERLSYFLSSVVGLNQTTFILGRQISENILFCQDLLHNYHKGNKGKRVAIKINFMKAFDMVKWEAVLGVLRAINVPQHLFDLIAQCITTPRFSINLNGKQVGYFAGTNGLRQGDPLSPYLFVLVMEILNRIIIGKVAASSFKYHWRCKTEKITHLCFADDLFLFSHGDVDSVICLVDVLDEFAALSGLHFNPDKCQIFFSELSMEEKGIILDHTPFPIGNLPIRYLGVPLITRRLTHADCKSLHQGCC